MCKIVNTILCYGIAMILLFFGMNFAEAGNFSRTQNAKSETPATIVCVGGATISEVDSFETQLVGKRSESSVQQLVWKSSIGKKDSRMLFCILIFLYLPDDYSNFNRATSVINVPNIFHRVAVLNYIHDLDGKKRVS